MSDQSQTERLRVVTWNDPMTSARTGRTLSGLEYMQALAEGKISVPPIGRALGFHLIEVEKGRAVFELVPDEIHYNPIGTVHGGVPSTLLDSAIGCAVHSMLPAGVGYTTVELKVNFVRPITVATGPMRCEGSVIHLGKRIATAEGRLLDAAGKLYSHASSTCMILESE